MNYIEIIVDELQGVWPESSSDELRSIYLNLFLVGINTFGWILESMIEIQETD